MTLSTVTVTWDEQDVGADALGGYVSFQLTADLQDQTDGIDVRRSPARTFFFTGPSGTSDPLAANDSAGITPAGTAYVITVAIAGQPPVTFTSQVNAGNGATQTLAFLQANAAVPAVQYAQYLPLTAGTPVAGYVPAVIADDSTATVWVPPEGGGSGYPASPVVSGTPSAGQVLTATSPTAADWQTPGSAAVASVFGRTGTVTAQSGDYTAAQVGAASTGALSSEATTRANADTALGSAITAITDEVGQPSGIASLDSGGKVPTAQIPTLNQNTTGNAATATNLAGGATLPDYLAPHVAALSQSGGTVAVNAAAGNAFNLSVAGSWTISNPTNPVDGQVIRFRLTSGGSNTTSWGTAYDFGTGSAPTLSATSGKVDIVAFEYVSSISKWCCLGSGLGY